MLSDKKYLFDELMIPGRYIMQRIGHNRKQGHCLYEGKMIPVRVINPRTFKRIKPLLKEKNGMMTIDLRLVRKLHGNSNFKKKYKAERKKKQPI